jgi:transcriptional regulator with XRE-family HTH domain
MRKSKPEFEWTKDRLQAAQLLAEARLTLEEIAAQAGITIRQLSRWKLLPPFAAKVQEIAAKLEAAILAKSIGQQAERIEQKHKRWLAMREVIEERKRDPELLKHSKTGLLVRRLKPVKGGVIEEFAVDTGLLGRIDDVENDAAKELGQLTEQHEHKGKLKVEHLGTVKLERDPRLRNLNREQLEQLLALRLAADRGDHPA